MKKYPLYLLTAIILLSSVLGLAKFTFEVDSTISWGEAISGPCAGGNDYVYCLGWANLSDPGNSYTRGNFYTYSPDTKQFEYLSHPVSWEYHFENPHPPYATAYNVAADLNTMCEYSQYYNQIYCYGVNWFYAGVYDTSGNKIKWIPDELYDGSWVVNNTEGGQACALQPHTERMWCWGGNYLEGSSREYMRYYDFSDNSSVVLSQINDGDIPSGGGCTFIDDTNMVCWGGKETDTFVYATSDQLMFYNTATDTHTYGTLAEPIDAWIGVGRVYNDVLYLYGYSIDNVLQDNVQYYDLVSHQSGILTRHLPNTYYFFQNCKPVFNRVKDFCIGGAEGIDWNYTNDVFAIQWSPCNERWMRNDTECVNKQAFRTYYDAEYCGTYDRVPSDNGTYVTCGGRGGSNAAAQIVQDNIAKQSAAKQGQVCQTTNSAGEVIVCNTGDFMSRLGSALQQVILNIRKAIGLG